MRPTSALNDMYAINETGWGRSELAVKANNYVGIKAHRGPGTAESLGPPSVRVMMPAGGGEPGPFVTVGPRPGSWAGGPWTGGRVTASVGYARTRQERNTSAPVSHALAAHVGAQFGGFVSDDDTTAVFLAGRAQVGAVLLPRLALLHGPTVGLTPQVVTLPD